MTDEAETIPAGVRAATHADLRAYAANLFAARPELQSVMVAVAQYWADEADDAVHAHVVCSERAVPLWPHDCRDPSDGIDQITGEHCEYCCDDIGYLPFDDNGPSIVGFAAYCHEQGSQEEPQDENYLPYAIVRRAPAGEELPIEVVGHLLRGYDEVDDDGDNLRYPPTRFDDRAAELYELACRSTDEGPRRVLADYLLEQEDPRGEYMSLALAAELDDSARARRDEILADYGANWMFPLTRLAPLPPIARFERGLLAHVEVYSRDPEVLATVAGSKVWNSVESVRIIPESFDIVDREMISLRRLGPIGRKGLAMLAEQSWNIETLAVRLDTEADRYALLALSTLPRLRELVLSGPHIPAPYRVGLGPDGLTAAPWWPQLTKLTVLAPSIELESLLPWLGAQDSRLRAVAIAEVGHHGGPAGWELAYVRGERLIEVRMPAFSANGRRARLIELLDRGPDGRVELIGGACWRPTADDVAALAASGRAVTIR